MINLDQKLATFAKLTVIRQLEKGVEKGYDVIPWDSKSCSSRQLEEALRAALARRDWAAVATYAIMLEARDYNNRRQAELENGNG